MGRVEHSFGVYICFLLSFTLLSGCGETENSEKIKVVEKPTVTYIKAPEFNADSAYYFIQKQIDFGYRVPNTASHAVCGDWLVAKFNQYNAQVIEQRFKKKAYDLTVLDLRNIIAIYNPDAKKRILLGAHWDTRHIADRDSSNKDKPFDGANDGGSGVGVLLEIARQLSITAPNVGVDIILFDGEDYGQPDSDTRFPYMENSWCFGSQYWAKNPHEKNYKAEFGILLDMVGARGARFAKEGVSRYYAPQEVEKIWRTAHRIGYSSFFWNHNSPEIIDDHLYVNRDAKIPMVDIIEYNPNPLKGGYFGDYHHTHDDNMSIIDKATLKAVGQTVLEVIYNE
jgi:glutaminyl-peptide cyclotransferase